MRGGITEAVWGKAVWGKAVWGAAIALSVLLPATTAAGPHHRSKIDRLLAQDSSDAPRRVIIRTTSGGKSLVRQKLLNHGDIVYGDHPTIDALAARVHAEDLAALANDPDVLSISSDARITASQLSLAAGDNDFGFLGEVRATLGLSGLLTGQNITVAIIDSGLTAGLDFDGRILGFYNFTGGKAAVPGAPTDEFGHGTHVAGLIGSNGRSSDKKYVGVAPNVKFLGLKVLDRTGAGYTSDVIRALEFAVANRDRFNIRIVNLSLGHPIYESAASDPLVQAVEHAVRAGLIVVTAAGNHGLNPATGTSGYAGVTSPGNAPSAITVGAASSNGTISRADDRVAPFSSRGPSWYDGIAKPDVVAPGDGLVSNLAVGSTLADAYSTIAITNGSAKYLRLRGSSMAAGVVTGVVALMLESNHYGEQLRSLETWLFRRLPSPSRRLGANAIKALLQYSATPLRDAEGRYYDVLTQGTGLVNGSGAVVLAGFADTTQPVGSFWIPSTIQPWTRFEATDEAWSQTVTWGTRLLRGSSLIDINQSAWSDNIVWGTGELDNIVWGTADAADNIVWGTALSVLDISWSGNVAFDDNIVWGTLDWADNIVWGTGLLGCYDGDNIVWGTFGEDNIVWGTLSDDNIVWGTIETNVTNLGSSLIGGGL